MQKTVTREAINVGMQLDLPSSTRSTTSVQSNFVKSKPIDKTHKTSLSSKAHTYAAMSLATMLNRPRTRTKMAIKSDEEYGRLRKSFSLWKMKKPRRNNGQVLARLMRTVWARAVRRAFTKWHAKEEKASNVGTEIID